MVLVLVAFIIMILIIFLLIRLLGELFWQSRLKKGGTELEPWGSTINSDIQATGLSLLAILIILNPLLICFKALGHNYYVSSCRFPLLSWGLVVTLWFYLCLTNNIAIFFSHQWNLSNVNATVSLPGLSQMHVFGLVAGVAIEIAATLKFIVWNRFDFCLLNDRVIFKQCHLSYTSILLLWNEYLNYMNFWLKEKNNSTNEWTQWFQNHAWSFDWYAQVTISEPKVNLLHSMCAGLPIPRLLCLL